MIDHEEIKVKCVGGGSIISQAPIFSPDGQCLYIPWTNLIRCYNVKTGERIFDLEGCENKVIGVRFHPKNSDLLVGCSITGEIAIWKWQARLLISVHKIKHGIDKVTSFHLLSSDDECNIILSWISRSKYNLGQFSLKKLAYKTNVAIVLPKKINAVGLGSLAKSPFIAAIDDINVICAKLDGSKKVSYKSGDRRSFTCLACHPENDCIATGDSVGRVVVWRGLFSKKTPAKSIYHWHTLPVNTIAFSQTGSVLYSGGSECVIVKWQLESLNKNFLPRLPAPVVHLSSAPGNVFMAISTADNAIHITDAQFRPKTVIQHLTWAVSTAAGMKIDSRTKSLVMNGHVGNVQFYSPHTMSLLYNLDVVGLNKLTEEQNIKISNTNVSKIGITKSGDWLACIEDRVDNGVYQEIKLKFFQYNDADQSFILNTCIEYPHEDGVNSLEFQPPCNSTNLLCATTGNDNQFKIWSLVDTSDIYRKSRAWNCWSSASYKSLPSSCLSFSSDGSLLVVGFGACLTAWAPDTCELKCSLVHPSFRSPLREVRCGNVDQCHLVVAASSERLCVWNLLTLALLWTVPVRVAHLCADPLSTYMAVFTKDDNLFIFCPDSPSPIFCKNVSGNNKIVSATFVPRISENTGHVWQRFSQLYFINRNQELLCLKSTSEITDESALDYIPEAPKTAFGSLIAQNSISTTMEKDKMFNLGQGLSGATEIKQLIEPPVHTMAPMRLLCGSVLRSLITRECDLPKEDTSRTDIDNEDSVEEKDNSDSDTDYKSKRKTIKIPKPKNVKTKTKKEDLQNVFSDSYKWTQILLD